MTGMPPGSFRRKSSTKTLEKREFSNEYLNCKNWLDKKIQKLLMNQSSTSPGQHEADAPEKDTFQGVRVRRMITKKSICTFIDGLQQYGIDLEYACHLFSGVFRTKAKVVGPDEICINGDVLNYLKYHIPYYWPEVGEILCEKELMTC
ncbi:unnamed protein product [Nezara viridula]|uniref:Uncharacterized protein n=1 Tax=Nezara viridula TaxID=85310 RepID=A0A9P0H6Z7_NEZVI|nr:unnamed protein product [Nezara viridula]